MKYRASLLFLGFTFAALQARMPVAVGSAAPPTKATEKGKKSKSEKIDKHKSKGAEGKTRLQTQA